jgi:hypothetical protein
VILVIVRTAGKQPNFFRTQIKADSRRFNLGGFNDQVQKAQHDAA